MVTMVQKMEISRKWLVADSNSCDVIETPLIINSISLYLHSSTHTNAYFHHTDCDKKKLG